MAVESPTVADLLASRPFDATDELRTAARSALTRVSGEDSEWRELWGEVDGLLQRVGDKK